MSTPKGFTCLISERKRAEKQASDAMWNGEYEKADRLYGLAERLKQRIQDGEAHEPNF